MTSLLWLKWSENEVWITTDDDPAVGYANYVWSHNRPACVKNEPPTAPFILTASYTLILTEAVYEQIKDLNFTTLYVKAVFGIKREEVDTIIKIATSGRKVGIIYKNQPLCLSTDMDIFQFHEHLLSIVT